MNYFEWNRRLADHFFPEGKGSEPVFLCATIDTLQMVSDIAMDQARADFVAAIKTGPEWTQIPGCSRVCSKALNCLYPDPGWRYRRDRCTDKHDLSDHILWSSCQGHEYGEVPPYIAYLVCFVLAWTEREAGVHGANYYQPLNSLLGFTSTRDSIDTFDFGPHYSRDGHPLSTRDLWKNLQVWSYDANRGVCDLPMELEADVAYVSYPKYFGLMKAADLKALPSVFDAAEEDSLLVRSKLPDPTSMLAAIREKKRAGPLSNEFVDELVINGQITNLQKTYGALLLAKYKNWDGAVEEKNAHTGTGFRRCRAVILRKFTLQGGVSLTAFCAFRGRAWENLPLSTDEVYKFKTDEHDYESRWIAGTAYFTDLNTTVPQILGDCLEFECEGLGRTLKARLERKDLIVFAPGGLKSQRFEGFYIEEVDDLVVGREYRLLTRPDVQPPEGLHAQELHVGGLPTGWRLLKFTCPDGAGSIHPDLPPVERPRTVDPRIRIDALVRAEVGQKKFFIQCPPILWPPDGHVVTIPKVLKKLELPGGAIIPLPTEQGSYSFSLTNLQGHALEGSEVGLEFLDLSSRPLGGASGQHPADDPPGYPSAAIELTGGTRVGSGDTAFLKSNPPTPRLQTTLREANMEVCFNRKAVNKIPAEAGTVEIAVVSHGIPIAKKKFKLIDAPQISICEPSDGYVVEVRGEALMGRLSCDLEGVAVSYEVHDANGRQVLKGIVDANMQGILVARCEKVVPDIVHTIKFKYDNKEFGCRRFRFVKRDDRDHGTDHQRRPPYRPAFRNNPFGQLSISDLGGQKRGGA